MKNIITDKVKINGVLYNHIVYKDYSYLIKGFIFGRLSERYFVVCEYKHMISFFYLFDIYTGENMFLYEYYSSVMYHEPLFIFNELSNVFLTNRVWCYISYYKGMISVDVYNKLRIYDMEKNILYSVLNRYKPINSKYLFTSDGVMKINKI